MNDNIELRKVVKGLREEVRLLRSSVVKSRENFDGWIKQIKREVSEYENLPVIASENIDNIQHNYELIYEIKDEIEGIKQDLNALKLIQIITIKQNEQQTKLNQYREKNASTSSIIKK